MRAILRGIAVLLAGAISLEPAAALAQDAQSPPTTATPPSDAVGPRELQNFSLSGNVTKPAEQQAPAPPAIKPPPPSQLVAGSATTVQRRVAPTREQSRQPDSVALQRVPEAAPAPSAQPSSGPATPAPAAAATLARLQPGFAPPALPPTSTAGLTAEHGFSIAPWLLAALAVAAGLALLLWLRRPREPIAGPQFDLFTAREPELVPAHVPDAIPAPARPTPPKPKAPAASGIVASRLRPSIELGVQPLRCVVEDSQVVIEFEVELFNAGAAPARAVLAEASLLNAGATQDKDLINFFANPVGAGERLDSIPPMRRVNFASRVVAPRGAIQEYEVGGRRAFVPVIAFNALYEWSGGKAQTSAAYLVGRETRGEKLGPLHLDLGPRAFTSLGARTLPATVRT